MCEWGIIAMQNIDSEADPQLRPVGVPGGEEAERII